ncbi:MAG: aminopeptidase [Flavobacteriales bacterium]|nr:aminopeptidase [Flavobacteriales bacterium]
MLFRKWIIDVLLASLLFAGAWHGDLLDYAWKAARGQFRILLNVRSVKSYLSDLNVPDSLKLKVRLIQEIKQFTIDSLGFSNNKNYTTIYDQQGKPLLWVVTASERFALNPYFWNFPIVGTVSYKGFFSENEALEEAEWLEKKGYETRIRQVNAWSTLGWFKDPIMTSMLDDKPGDLANLIIHELFHRTVYVKNNVDYSEKLASFIGDKGARLFLKYKYGENSFEYLDYLKDDEDYKRFANFMLHAAKRLDSLYADTRFKSLSENDKVKLKQTVIQTIVNDADTIHLHERSYVDWLKKQTPNNALFIIFRQYNNQQEEFEKEYQRIAKGKLKDYVLYLKSNYSTD